VPAPVSVIDAPSNLGLRLPGPGREPGGRPRPSGGVYVPRRLEEDREHFLTVSFWDSTEKIEGFAGAAPEKARYYPEDERFLLHFEPTVGHYEVVVGP
jgi:hypothetical protein